MFEVIFSMFMATFMFGFFILFYGIFCIGRMKMFQKAGVEGWKAWIPFYRDYVLCEITMGKGWYFVFGLIPPLMPVMRVVYAIEVTLAYGQELLFGVAYFFLPWLCELILGFGRARYAGGQDLDRQLRRMFGAEEKTCRQNPDGTWQGSYRDVKAEEPKSDAASDGASVNRDVSQDTVLNGASSAEKEAGNGENGETRE